MNEGKQTAIGNIREGTDGADMLKMFIMMSWVLSEQLQHVK